MHTANILNVNDVIDMKGSDYAQSLFDSLLYNRYAVLDNHPIELNNLDNLYQEWSDFFSYNDEMKYKYLYSSETDDGYVPINFEHMKDTDEPDLKEFYQIHLEELYGEQNVCSLGTKKLFECLVNLGESLVKIIDEALPAYIKEAMTDFLWESTKGSNRHCMRFIHYPPCGDTGKLYRSSPHDDICLLTIILPARGEGLMMQKNKGWQEENAKLNSLIVFNSEMLEIATAGYLKSMTHHVTTDLINDARSVSRYSMPFFVHPRSNMFLNKELTSHAAVRQRIVDTGLNKIG